MRGTFVDQGGLFSYIAPEARVPANHPLRKIRELVRDVLGELTRSLGRLYASEGRPSIPPEQLLSALLLQVFYGIRSERQLMEQLDYNLLYRWFVDFRPTTRSGTRRPSRRTAIGCRPARYLPSS
jgi:Transposase and inactivated derivatives